MYEFWYDQRQQAVEAMKKEPETVEEYHERKELVNLLRSVIRMKNNECEGMVVTCYDKDMNALRVDDGPVYVHIDAGNKIRYFGVDLKSAGTRRYRSLFTPSVCGAAHALYTEPKTVSDNQRRMFHRVKNDVEYTEILVPAEVFNRLQAYDDDTTEVAVLHINIPF